jgi:hypothetical protein
MSSTNSGTVCTYRLVATAFNRNTTGAEVSRVRADSSERLTLQTQDKRRAKLKRSAIQRSVNCTYSGIVLPEAISGFRSSLLPGIGNQLRFERTAISPFALITCHLFSLANFSASRSTISRVISSFSKWVFP